MKGLTTKGGTPRIALCPPRQRRGGGDLKGGEQGGNAPAERVAPRRFCIFKARMLIWRICITTRTDLNQTGPGW